MLVKIQQVLKSYKNRQRNDEARCINTPSKTRDLNKKIQVKQISNRGHKMYLMLCPKLNTSLYRDMKTVYQNSSRSMFIEFERQKVKRTSMTNSTTSAEILKCAFN